MYNKRASVYQVWLKRIPFLLFYVRNQSILRIHGHLNQLSFAVIIKHKNCSNKLVFISLRNSYFFHLAPYVAATHFYSKCYFHLSNYFKAARAFFLSVYPPTSLRGYIHEFWYIYIHHENKFYLQHLSNWTSKNF